VFDGPDSESAYVNVTLDAGFRSDGATVRVPGFYDGDGKYKVRFSPADDFMTLCNKYQMVPIGLNDPDQIDQGGWGGRFSFNKKKNIRSMSGVTRIRNDGETRFDPYYRYGNTAEKAGAITCWSKGYDNDLAARMDWTMTPDYAKANHHPVAVVNGDLTGQVLNVTASGGSTVAFSTEGSSDPDGDSRVYAWSFYKDPSSYKGSVNVQNSNAASAAIEIPSDASGKNIHVIFELHDNGPPNLYAYRRVISNLN